MTDLSYLIAPSLAFLIAAGAPGPATLATAATAMARGRRAGLAIGFGLTIGLALWGIVAAAGLGAAILAWAPALFALRIGGGLFLLWLAWKSARAALRPGGMDAVPSLSGGDLVRRGLLLNLLNPKAVLAWGAVIAIGLPAQAQPAHFAAHFAAIVAACSAIGAAVYVFYAIVFSLPPVRAWYAGARRWIDAACAAAFAVAGLRLMVWRAGTT